MKKSLILLLFSLLLLLTGCPDEPPVQPEDPCLGVKPISASFKIYEVPNFYQEGWINYDSDTIATLDITFVADADNAIQYEWYIGSEIINTKTVTRKNFPRDQAIPITLVVRGTPNTKCFPNDDGIDTVTRLIHTLSDFYKPACSGRNVFGGKYFGYNIDEQTKPYTIELTECFPDSSRWNEKTIRLQNLTPNCDISTWDFLLGTFKQIFLASYNNYAALTPNCFIRIYGSRSDSIEIRYNIQKKPGWQNVKDRIDKKFIGVRVK